MKFDEQTLATRAVWRGFAFVAAVLVTATLCVGALRLRPPTPQGVDAPHEVFSEARARAQLAALVPTDDPRPLGSQAHDRTRDTIVARFQALGLKTEVLRRWRVLPGRGRAAWVENILATLEGGDPARPVLVVAHYDSVGAGPGAGDDAMSVAAMLEVARALRAGSPRPRTVQFLVTDGEEAGLIGALAHVDEYPAADYHCVLNFDARGTRGASLCFETGDASGQFITAWADHAGRPVGSSLYAEIYRQMENDTDFTVFRRGDAQGLNFAAIGGIHDYHTSRDTVARVDAGTLQHHGEQMLAAVRGALDVPDGTTPQVLVWFDVLGFGLVSWSGQLTIWLAGAALAFVLLALWRDDQAMSIGRGRRVEAFLSFFAPLIGAAAGVFAALGVAHFLGSKGALGNGFPAEPGWTILAYAAAAGAGLSLVYLLLARVVGAGALASSWLAWTAAGGVALAVIVPPAAFVLVFPALVSGILWSGLTFFPSLRSRAAPVGATIFALLTAVVVAPSAVLLPDALPTSAAPFHAAVWVLLLAPLAPFVVALGWRGLLVTLGALAVGGGAVFGAIRAPLVTDERPARLTMVYRYEPEDPHAHLFLEGDAPAQMRAMLGARDEPRRILPWGTTKGFDCSTERVELDQPTLEDLSTVSLDGGRRVSFRLASARGATTLWFAVDRNARLRATTIGGKRVPPVQQSGGYIYRFYAVPKEGVEVTLEFADTAPVAMYVGDATPGLPPSCARAVQMRPTTLVTSQDGDQTICVRKVKL